MYAPKDDLKHRALWRELYTVEEAEQLTSLISVAKENSIEFVYALSPGLDITYSSPKETVCLKRKLEQVQQIGCTSFALLFDDIEPDISETDKEVFQSFAQAQVSVTNEIFQTLGQPRFIFCPTEYCTTRAMPNVQNSDYLKTIGTKLLPDIDIMWTGSKVISKVITVQSVQELAEVLKRKPVIWDNIHANDYDQKRLFLGPYSGRSTDLIPHLRGVFTNPNCEYEPNFIAIHTLAQWSKCSSDAKCDVSADIKLETERENGSVEDIPTHLSPHTYHPKKALKLAIEEWLPEFSRPKSGYGKSTASFPNINLPGPPCVTLTPGDGVLNTDRVPENGHEDLKMKEPDTGPDNDVEPIKEIESSRDEAEPTRSEKGHDEVEEKDSGHPLEPMDCNPTPGSSPKHLSDAQMEDPVIKNDEVSDKENEAPSSDLQSNKDAHSLDSAEEMQTESASECSDAEIESRATQLTYDDVALLVDLFYLPFEHGQQGLQFLHEFQWLKSNGYLVSEEKKKLGEPQAPEVTEWYQRADKFEEMTASVGRMLTRLTFCKNRALLYDLYPYVWDVKGVISVLNSYVKWLGKSRNLRLFFV